MFQFGFEDHFGMGRPPQPYNCPLRCNSAIVMSSTKGAEIERGGKIILPPSALDNLTRLHIQFPMLFKLTNKSKQRSSHCGVLEFVAEEGRCYLPHWMMRNLLLDEHELVQVEYVTLPIAKFAKFEPQSVEFLEITNPKAVLENSLRNFATLTKDDIISINYNEKDYELRVLETKPGNAVSIIECDMDVDFAPPVGYVEPQYKQPAKESIPRNIPKGQKPQTEIGGKGHRLDGKSPKNSAEDREETSSIKTNKEPTQRGIPNYDYVIGTLTFHRDSNKPKEEPKKEDNDKKANIGGTGIKLKHIGVIPK